MALPGDRNVTQKEAEKLSTGFMYRDKTNVEHEMYRTGKIRATGLVTKGFREKLGNHTRKTFNRFITKDSCTWNITHNVESTAV